MPAMSLYQIGSLIYESDNSLVYRAHRVVDDQPVVLKILNQDSPRPETIAWFKREYERTKSLNLPGVVQVYSFETDQHRCVMVLEDFGGDSLDLCMQRQPFTLAEFLPLAVQIVEILAQVHQQQVIHKDVNPSNIVLNRTTGQLKLIDFGISTMLSRENPTFRNPNMLEGTLAYISPEQTGRMNRAVDYRTDFYSLGVTLYELLTGQLPFQSTDAMELLHAHIARHPIPAHELNPDIPHPLSDIVLKLMAKNAEDRYQSAYGLKADLESCWRQWQATGHVNPFALGQHEVCDRFQIPQKLYGRGPEVEALLAAFERVSQGAAEMMLVTGYAGIGKSVLVQEMYKPITHQRGFFIAGKFDQLHHEVPYAPLLQAFRSLVRQLLSEDEAQIATWRDKLLAALGPNGQVVIEVVPEVELIIGPQSKVPVLDPGAAQNRFHLVFQNFVHVFSQPEHPLVLFLDDLQWTDAASLQLLQLLMTAPDSHYLFVIGAYRDHDMSSAHPLQLALNNIRQAGAVSNHIVLGPLELADTNQLIAEALASSPERTQPLATLVLAKTDGNPFFINEFLKSLYTEKLLEFDFEQVAWKWDLARIQAQNLTDNAVELMTTRMRKLPDKTRRVLELAACIGNRFDLQTLAIVYDRTLRETAADLWDSIAEGLIVPLGETYKLMEPDVQGLTETVTVEYRFAHDRIQQAAYTLIPAQDRQATHLRVGQSLLRKTPPEELEQKIFDIVNQLNRGLDHIQPQTDRVALAELNFIAGTKSKTSAAYQAALTYLQTGIDLLDDNSWESHHGLALALYLEAAETACFVGNYEKMTQLLDVVLQHAKTVLDKVKAFGIQLLSYSAQDQLMEGIRVGLQMLNMLGFPLPDQPSQADVRHGLEETRLALPGKDIETLLDLPPMTDPMALAAMDALVKLTLPAYNALPTLSVLINLKMVYLSVKYGNTPLSVKGYVSYGLILCNVVNDIDLGYRFGEFALRLAERLQAKHVKPSAIFIFNIFIRHWKEHIKETIKPLPEVYERSLESGNVEFACFSFVGIIIQSYWSGKNLTEFEQDARLSCDVISRHNQEHSLNYAKVYWQMALNLMNRSIDTCRLIGEAYDEEAILPFLIETNNMSVIGNTYCNKVILFYLFQEYAQAVEYADLTKPYLMGLTGTMASAAFHFYDSLVRLALFADAETSQQEHVLEKVAANQAKMHHWAQHAPMNFQHKWYLVEAEHARVLGQATEAREFYDQAIALAQEHGFIQEEALANELAGKFYLARGQNHVARHYLFDAYYAYQRWGAEAKVKDLETRYPQFLLHATGASQPTLFPNTTTTVVQTSGTLDFTSALKAAQAISSEIVLDKLLDRLMHTVIENAGAQKGCLILNQEGALVIEAEKAVHTADVVVLQSIPIETRHDLPVTLIRYVERTQESVVLNNAIQDNQFTTDLYITTQSPKSILCIPLLKQGALSGMLYLENTLTRDAFTPDRLEVLKVLSSQAAIAIENAQLYSTLEQRVTERTQELRQKNAELENTRQAAEAANRAKSTFLANMSHEIRTPLNAILGYANILERDAELNARQVTAVKTIADSGHHLLELINEILDISTIEAGRMELQASDFDLIALIDRISKMFEGRCQEKGLAWRVEWRQGGRTVRGSGPTSRLVVQGDEGKLRQVLINLLSNAVKCTESGDVILRLDIAHHTDSIARILFDVIDTGMGIAKGDQAKIFRVFDRATSVEPREGTGLGLPIAQKQVELMGGHLSVESEPGAGARFFFTLAFTLPSAQATETGKRPANIIRLAKGFSVKALIVDDVADNRAVLADMLQDIGVDIDTAEDGRQALEHVTVDRPDIVFMDIRMPNMDGVSAAQHLIDTYGQERPKLIAVSASALRHERERYLAAGFDEFISKPIVAQQVYRCLANLLPVEFVSQASEKIASEVFEIELPDDLYEGIKQAAETYRVSQLDRHFDAVAQLSSAGRRLAERLRERKQNGDMDGITQLLAQLRQGHKERM
jgi:predicted ATPase/signal transduction histidine kinase/CheY-like chemotaxis protein